MGRHHSRLTCAAARARTATCSSAASSTKRLAAQAESGREPARHSLREKCNALHCQRVKRAPASLELGLFPPYCLATPRVRNITQPDELKYYHRLTFCTVLVQKVRRISGVDSGIRQELRLRRASTMRMDRNFNKQAYVFIKFCLNKHSKWRLQLWLRWDCRPLAGVT